MLTQILLGISIFNIFFTLFVLYKLGLVVMSYQLLEVEFEEHIKKEKELKK